MPNWSIALIPLLPLFATLWIAIGFIVGWNRHEKGEKETALTSLITIASAFFLVIFADINTLTHNLASEVHLGTWLNTGDYPINISFLLDPLALTMATLISFISLLVTKFSINYLHREAGFQRFFMLISLFNAAMLLIVLAGNAVLTFIAWELAGVSSFLLIAYSWHREVATNNAMRAFISNRIGDTGFVMAIAFSFFWLGTVEWTEQAKVIETAKVSQIFVGLILLGFIIAACAKSAQLPFSAWISRALEGPTPSSAVFYGALMVHAGVYLLLRLQPILEYVPALMLMIAFIGGLTAVYGYLVALVQSDVKSSFMFSTLSQVGLMLVWIGNGWFTFALVHLVFHAIWRTYQFLHAPSFLQQVTRPARPVPAWLQKRKSLHTAALQRFWLDGISDYLLTKPTCNLSHEVQIFDEKVVDRLTGIQSHANVIASLSHWEAQQKGTLIVKDNVGTANGLLGFLMQQAASGLHRFEERFILKGSGESLLKVLRFLGHYLENIDQRLMQPRYLLVLVMATFIVIL